MHLLSSYTREGVAGSPMRMLAVMAEARKGGPWPVRLDAGELESRLELAYGLATHIINEGGQVGKELWREGHLLPCLLAIMRGSERVFTDLAGEERPPSLLQLEQIGLFCQAAGQVVRRFPAYGWEYAAYLRYMEPNSLKRFLLLAQLGIWGR